MKINGKFDNDVNNATYPKKKENMADKLDRSVTIYTKIERGEVRSNFLRLEQISKGGNMDICEQFSCKIYFNHSVTDSTNSNNFMLSYNMIRKHTAL